MKQIFTLFFPLLLLSSCNKQPPSDVTLNKLSQGVNGINISWAQSPDTDFSSYSLYKNNSSGIDQSNSDLVHVSTSVTDNSFIDLDFNPLQTYFYRVYIQNDQGTSIGSNIESITAETISIVSNGSFETGTSIPTNWSLIDNSFVEPLNSITISNNTAADGTQSLKFHSETSSGCFEQWISQNVPITDFTPGGTYEFSFSYYSGNVQVIPQGPNMGFRIYNTEFDIRIALPDFPGDGQWHNFTSNFVLPSIIESRDILVIDNPSVQLHFCTQGPNDWWIDNINVVKVQ